MHVGILQLELRVLQACSLKDKRRVIKSLKDRIANTYNVSIAEVGALDEYRRSLLGIALVANDKRFVESCLSKLVDYVRTNPDAILQDYKIELL